MVDIVAYLTQEKTATKEVLLRFVNDQIASYTNLDEDYARMLGYLPDYLEAGGKWARPTLARLAYAYVEGDDLDREVLVKASASLELFHRFILCHDDIVDRDLMRHGGPTLEKRFIDEMDDELVAPIAMHGVGMAMIAGDILHALVQRLVIESGLHEKTVVRVVDGYVACLMETAAGWRKETLLKERSIASTSHESIRQAMILVSAHYSVLWPLRMGQLFAGMDDWNEDLETYGKEVGFAFQMQDDILGMFGESEQTGKPVGADYREGKKTLLLQHAYQNSGPKTKEMIEATLGKSVDAHVIARVQAIMRDKGSVDYVKKLARTHAKKGIEALQAKNRAVTYLKALGIYLVEREL